VLTKCTSQSKGGCLDRMFPPKQQGDVVGVHGSGNDRHSACLFRSLLIAIAAGRVVHDVDSGAAPAQKKYHFAKQAEHSNHRRSMRTCSKDVTPCTY
jgi:hypothetical protein